MREETMKVLKMVEEGKITSEQAAQLIEAANLGEDAVRPEANGSGKWLKIRVYDVNNNKKKVNVSVPTSLISLGLKLGMKFGLDKEEFKDLDIDEIMQMIRSGEEGKIIDVLDEEKGERVEIFVD